MRERRFFVDSLDRSKLRLEGPEHHHMLRVLRLRAGDSVVLFDGRGRAAAGAILRLDDTAAEIELGAALPSRESSLSIRLAVVVPKGDRMSFVVQKATELGVVEIVPLSSERGEPDEKSLFDRAERWRRVALEACKQSGRSRIPEVAAPLGFSELVERIEEPRESLWVAQQDAEPPAVADAATDSTICIGPEGGFSGEELRLARDRGARLFGLGPRTLRTETAAISAVALFQWLAGDWGPAR